MELLKQILNNTTFGIDTDTLLIIFGPISIMVVGFMAYLLFRQKMIIRVLHRNLEKLEQSFRDLDEQAKLIVRTDLVLNKTQEELDKRLTSLNALHKISFSISTTLDADEVYHRLGYSFARDLGFEKSCLLIRDPLKNFQCQAQRGFSKEAIENIRESIHKDPSFVAALREGKSFSSLNCPPQKIDRIIQIFNTKHFILNPIITQEGMVGLLFVGNHTDSLSITQSDEELSAILSNQIRQSLENAKLFEAVFRSRKDLESNVQERTKELTSALDALKRISRAKSEFVSAVSHELRTPLTSIKGYASILMTGKIGHIPPDVKERLEKINKHSDNLVKFINDLLDVARIESGRAEMKFITTNIIPIIDNARDILAPQMKEKNIQFVMQLGTAIPHLTIDTSQIERVFINLLNNAIKFTGQNGSITFRSQPQPPHVLFEISDTGIGIGEEDLPKLFDEFYRVDNAINQSLQGTGLGLTLVKNIIEAHKGKIWVTSKINQGTTFHFTLPISQT